MSSRTPVADRPSGSIARRAFDDALRIASSLDPDPVDRAIPLRYTVPECSRQSVTLNGRPPLDAGPLSAALGRQAAGDGTSVELVESALAAIDALDGALDAMVAVDAERALREAATCDADSAAGRWRGPLHGIPITIKDVIDVAGLPTRGGSAAYQRLATTDATAVSLLRDAGAIVVGKASTHEFALGVTNPQTKNPHDRGRIPGGSSGGSAVSIAAGMALGSLGTDTRASIRVPAALTGVVGFKPTFGVIPTGGVLSLSWTMDHVAPMAATVSDVAVMLEVLLGRPVSSPSVASTAGVRIGVADATFLGLDADVDATVRDVIGALAMAEDIDVVDTVRPAARDFEVANAVGLIVSRCEAAVFHRGLALDRSRYWDEVADQLEVAEAILAVDYLDAQRLRGQLADELLEVFATVDVFAMPTAPVIAPRTDDFADYLMVLAHNAIPWSLVGFPAVSIPCGRAHGLPIGIQLVAAPHREDLLVALGLITERIVSCS